MRALWAAASGMIAQQLNVDTIANNLANVNTAGFKRSRVDFQDVLYQTLRVPGSVSAEGVDLPTGLQVGLGTRMVSSQRILAPGTFAQTENGLDLAIKGNGFFQILQPNGEVVYTRAGSFRQNRDGTIVNSDGFPLDPQMVIPTNATSVSVGVDGTVSVTVPNQVEPQVLGQIELATFPNPAGLEAIGRGLYRATGASGPATNGTPGADGLGEIESGALEMSNVQVVEELVNMIVAQRAYEANSRAIQVADHMLETANNARA